MNSDKICYTCITGNYDTLLPIKKKTTGWRYICFTDCDIRQSETDWEIRPIPVELYKYTQVKRQRLIKILPHLYLPKHDISVWIDANISVCENLDAFVEKYCGSADFSALKHKERNCIYNEIRTCIALHKENQVIGTNLYNRYKKENFPQNFGLNETGIIVRKNTKIVTDICNLWGKELAENSHRDQLSFNYCLWKMNYKVNDLPPMVKNNVFSIRNHKKNNYKIIGIMAKRKKEELENVQKSTKLSKKVQKSTKVKNVENVENVEKVQEVNELNEVQEVQEVQENKTEKMVSCLMLTYDRLYQKPVTTGMLFEQAVRQFAQQTYENRELIIVNSGSRIYYEDCENKLKSLEQEYGKLNCKMFFVTKEEYPTIADLRNKAVSEANGGYIMTWDDDDSRCKELIEKEMKAMVDNNADIVMIQKINVQLQLGAGKTYPCNNFAGFLPSMLAKKNDGILYYDNEENYLEKLKEVGYKEFVIEDNDCSDYTYCYWNNNVKKYDYFSAIVTISQKRGL